MTHNYTPELLIKYVYKEIDIADRLELEYALETNVQLRTQYHDILNTYTNLPKAIFSPKNSTIDNVLSYSNLKSLETNI